jgi:hypothetical protein
MPRYVILRHEVSGAPHFDFMLEMGEALRTWSLAEPPLPGGEYEAAALPDHRPAYLDYEGPVSGDRGFVARWDQGRFEIERQSEEELVVRLEGEKLAGWAFWRLAAPGEKRWRLLVLGSC